MTNMDKKKMDEAREIFDTVPRIEPLVFQSKEDDLVGRAEEVVRHANKYLPDEDTLNRLIDLLDIDQSTMSKNVEQMIQAVKMTSSYTEQDTATQRPERRQFRPLSTLYKAI